jgi:hypothetical protein
LKRRIRTIVDDSARCDLNATRTKNDSFICITANLWPPEQRYISKVLKRASHHPSSPQLSKQNRTHGNLFSVSLFLSSYSAHYLSNANNSSKNQSKHRSVRYETGIVEKPDFKQINIQFKGKLEVYLTADD